MTAVTGVALRIAELARHLTTALGPDAVVTDEAERRTYECDGLTHHRSVPALVVLPRTAEQVQAVVVACRDAGVPWVARGSGTGLSGGALPHAEGVLIVTIRLRRILDLDLANGRAVVEPGVVNLAISRAVEHDGWFYAPDPSSQSVCSIGGNVAENSGGAKCVKYGFTVHHVTGLQVCTPDGELVWIGAGMAATSPGYDLVGLVVGSEGTLGIVTKVVVRLLRRPEQVTTLLAGFASMAAAGAATSALIAAGLTPAAVEMMDALAITAAEQAVACQYPPGAGPCSSSSWTARRSRWRRMRRPYGGSATRTAPSRCGSRWTRPSGPRSGRAASPPSPPWAGSAATTSSRTG
jgi:glycolate oxidase